MYTTDSDDYCREAKLSVNSKELIVSIESLSSHHLSCVILICIKPCIANSHINAYAHAQVERD